MFLLMLLKYSEKSADVSLKPPWAACKSLIYHCSYSDPLPPKSPNRDRQGEAEISRGMLTPLLKTLLETIKRLAISREKAYDIAREISAAPLFLLVTKASVKLILQTNVLCVPGRFSSISRIISLLLVSCFPFFSLCSNKNKTRQTFTSPTCPCPWMSRNWRTCWSTSARSYPRASWGTPVDAAEGWALQGQSFIVNDSWSWRIFILVPHITF